MCDFNVKMIDFTYKKKYNIKDLKRIMQILRSKQGCPWDKQQTHHSIRNNLLEETYEVLEAIDENNQSLLKEELGDVLLQVIFHAQIESEKNTFDFDDVCDGIVKKLIRRHPHLFGDVIVDTTSEVLENWEEIKKIEKGITSETQSLNLVPKTLPSLMRCNKIQQRAVKAVTTSPDIQWFFEDMIQKINKMKDSVKQNESSITLLELGNLFFSMTAIARLIDKNPEQALEQSCENFIQNFSRIENLAKQDGIFMLSFAEDNFSSLWK